MGQTRVLAEGDGPQLAALFSKVFRGGRGANGRRVKGRRASDEAGALAAYLERLYLHDPSAAKDMPSLVHVDDSGRIYGFIGRHQVSMRLNSAGGGASGRERPVRGALISTIMVDDAFADPLAGAKLLKAALTGPQDFSFTETASELSLKMWQRLGGRGMVLHSLDWLRVIRPTGLMAEIAGERHRRLHFLGRLAAPGDRLLLRHIKTGEQHWWGLSQAGELRGGITWREVDAAAFAGLFERFTAHFALRPDFSADDLASRIAGAMEKPQFGRPVLIEVTDRGGVAIGGFFYHGRERASARLIQFLAAPGQESAVFDALIAMIAATDATAIRGRCQPFMMEAMLGRRIRFSNNASNVVHTRDAEIAAAIHNGDAFLNGIAGEQWSRLIGGEFG